MQVFISPPKRTFFLLQFGIWIAERITKNELLPARILAWYPKTAVGSGMLESLAAHKDKNISRRLLKLVRVQTSFAISCPFCIDMNSNKYKKYNISDEELLVLQNLTLSPREKAALEYAVSASQTPIAFTQELIEKVKMHFTEREMVILASTVAQVNYWGRLIQALGVLPAGFSDKCDILHLENYTTLKT